jgi:hypothetical protein
VFDKFVRFFRGQSIPEEVLVWEVDHLIIVGADYEIVYPGRADIEFDQKAKIAIASVTSEGQRPELLVEENLPYPVSLDVHVRTRGGFTLVGTDPDGNEATWYAGRAADDYVLAVSGVPDP